MAKIDIIQLSRPVADASAMEVLPEPWKSEFFQLLKGCAQSLSENMAVMPKKSGQEKVEMQAAARWPDSEPAAADMALLMALTQLVETQVQTDRPDTGGQPECEAAVTATAAEILSADTNIPELPRIAGEPQEVIELRQHDDDFLKMLTGENAQALPHDIKSVKINANSENRMAETVSVASCDKPAAAVLKTSAADELSDLSADRDISAGMGYAESSRMTDNLVSNTPEMSPQPEAVPVKTTPAMLPADVGTAIALNMPESSGAIMIELEPASLGKLTIRVVYEEGRAAVSIISSNPKTLEILSQTAGEIARILEDKTGQPTIVYTPEAQTERDGRLGSREHREQRQDQEQHHHRQQPDSFTQQLRLGLL